MVDAGYGTLPINQLANVTILDNQTIKVEPRDKAVLQAIETAIYNADTGLTPSNQSDYLYVKVPVLTTETREQLTKQVAKLGEESKIKIRQSRQDELKKIKKRFEDNELSEDQKRGEENKVDDITKEFTTTIDKLVDNKNKDIMTI